MMLSISIHMANASNLAARGMNFSARGKRDPRMVDFVHMNRRKKTAGALDYGITCPKFTTTTCRTE